MIPQYYLVKGRGIIYAKSELEFTKDYQEALRLPNIGEAMKLASKINDQLGTTTFQVFPLYETAD